MNETNCKSSDEILNELFDSLNLPVSPNCVVQDDDKDKLNINVKDKKKSGNGSDAASLSECSDQEINKLLSKIPNISESTLKKKKKKTKTDKSKDKKSKKKDCINLSDEESRDKKYKYDDSYNRVRSDDKNYSSDEYYKSKYSSKRKSYSRSRSRSPSYSRRSSRSRSRKKSYWSCSKSKSRSPIAKNGSRHSKRRSSPHSSSRNKRSHKRSSNSRSPQKDVKEPLDAWRMAKLASLKNNSSKPVTNDKIEEPVVIDTIPLPIQSSKETFNMIPLPKETISSDTIPLPKDDLTNTPDAGTIDETKKDNADPISTALSESEISLAANVCPDSPIPLYNSCGISESIVSNEVNSISNKDEDKSKDDGKGKMIVIKSLKDSLVLQQAHDASKGPTSEHQVEDAPQPLKYVCQPEESKKEEVNAPSNGQVVSNSEKVEEESKSKRKANDDNDISSKKSESSKSESSKSETSKSETSKSETSKSESSKSEPSKSHKDSSRHKRSRRSRSDSRDRKHSKHSKHKRRSRSKSRDRKRAKRRSRSRSRRSHSRSRRSHSRSRSKRSRSPRKSSRRHEKSPDCVDSLRDKATRKRLLEVARRNAVYLMANNCLPPSVEKESVKATGKSVDELTSFCKRLVTKQLSDSDASDPSLSPESGGQRDLDDNTFGPSSTSRHPFAIKDSKPIMMNIRNAPMLPTKTNAERLADTSKLREQFPVSSGSEHRTAIAETPNEWVPVEKKEEEEEEEDADKKVFPVVENKGPVDVSSLVSSRLQAMRRLQDNPTDSDARKALDVVQKDMQNWVLSKQQPGQFTGSTGVKVLSVEQLSAGFQAWARKDQFKESNPVKSHFGMKMLQKMGWSPGEGLGKNKEGQIEPLLLDVKMDKKGLSAQEEVITRKAAVPLAKSLAGKHPVSALVEICSKRKWQPPEFEIVFDCGPDHKKNFLIKVHVNNQTYKPAMAASTKKIAKANAAAACLQALGLIPKEDSTGTPETSGPSGAKQLLATVPAGPQPPSMSVSASSPNTLMPPPPPPPPLPPVKAPPRAPDSLQDYYNSLYPNRRAF